MVVKKVTLIIAIFLGVVIFSSVWYISLRQQPEKPIHQAADLPENTSSKTQHPSGSIIIDKDTDKAYDPTQSARASDIGFIPDSTQLFGMPQLELILSDVSNGPFETLFNDIQTALYTYGNKHLSREFATLTVIPSSLTINNSVINGTLRLGQTNTIVPLEIKIIGDKPGLQRGHIIINKSGSSYNGLFEYAGGLIEVKNSMNDFTIRQADTVSSSLIIQGTNKEAALSYISSIGYKISDLTITFTDYRSPFE